MPVGGSGSGSGSDHDQLLEGFRAFVASRESLEEENRVLREGLATLESYFKAGLEIVVSLKKNLRRPADIFDRSINELSLSVRTYNTLKDFPLGTVGDIVRKTEGELLPPRLGGTAASHKFFGRKSLNELKAILSDLGLRLGMSEQDILNWTLRHAK